MGISNTLKAKIRYSLFKDKILADNKHAKYKFSTDSLDFLK